MKIRFHLLDVFADVKSGRVTSGHRFLDPGPIELKAPRDYEAALEKALGMLDYRGFRAEQEKARRQGR